MQAIEFTTQITKQHEIHLKLPDDINATSVKVIVMYENGVCTEQAQKRVFGQYRGKIKISESFDDELGEDFWLDKE